MATKEDFIKKGREIERAMSELLDIWNELEHEPCAEDITNGIPEGADSSYPFTVDFHDMPIKVSNWLDEIEGRCHGSNS